MARPGRADDQRLAPVLGMVEYLHRGEEGIEVDMEEDGAHALSVPYMPSLV